MARLRKTELHQGEYPQNLDEMWQTIGELEKQQPEGTRVELVIQFAAWVKASWVKTAANTVESALRWSGVDPWPEESRLARADGQNLIIRWYKNPLWAWAIALAVAGIIAGFSIARYIFSRYDELPGLVDVLLPTDWRAWAALGLIAFMVVGPHFFRALDSYYRERESYRDVQRRALEALES